MSKTSDSQLPPPGDPNTIYLVDGSSYIFRAYYAIGHLSNSEGVPTGAVFGVANMILKLASDLKPAYLAWLRDSKTPTFRKDIYPEYKANRPPPPEDLARQFPIVHRLVDSFGISVLGCDGFEADDVAATIALAGVKKGFRVVIISGDKDLMQLVKDDSILMFDTLRNVIFDENAVRKKFGVEPRLLGDLLALTGDTSDNIPGVDGIGPKTAAKLIHEYGDLAGVLDAATSIKAKKLKANLEKQADRARLSRRLVELRKDVPVEFDPDSLRFGMPDSEKLLPVLKELEFNRLIAALPDIAGTGGVAGERKTGSYRSVTTKKGLSALIRQIRKSGMLCLDLETTSLDQTMAEIVGIALSWKPEDGVYIPVAHRGKKKQLTLNDTMQKLMPVLEDTKIKKVGQNIKYDHAILLRHGYEVKGWQSDSMLASYLLNPEKRSHKLDHLSLEFLGHRMISYNEVTQKTKEKQLCFDEVKVEQATEYAAEDADITLRLNHMLAGMIEKHDLDRLLYDIETPLAQILAEMELAGVLVDTDELKRLSDSLGDRISELESSAHEIAGTEFNIASPKQLQEILFKRIGLKPVKKTKTGFSTDSEVLETLAHEHDLPAIVLEHRMLAKLKNTYLDAFPKLVNPATGRIHTSYHQAATATGRLSSLNPNLQNIPVRTHLGREIRAAFVAPPGHMLLSADYSQVELRILAHLSGDEALISTFKNAGDVHNLTARAIYGLNDSVPITPEMRSAAKAVNFGVIYGKTDYGLSRELGIPIAEARRFIEDYFHLYSGVKEYMEKTIHHARQTGEVRTMLKRRRCLPDLNSPNHNARAHAERMARNTPVQGSAADLLKIAMINVYGELRSAGLRTKMILTVHDELVFEVPEKEKEKAGSIIRETMEKALNLSVPLLVDTGWGENWALAH